VQTAKPDGAVDGRSFSVTGAMTSLTGASGEDFASILRSLGYRMDRKPKPADVKPTAPVEITPAAAGIAPVAAEAVAESAPSSESSVSLLPNAELMPQAGEPAGEAVAIAPAETAAAGAAPAEPAPVEVPAIGADGAEAGQVGQAAEVAAAPAVEEPAFIEVWRPAGRAERRPHRPRRPRRQDAAATPQAPTAPSAEGGEAVAAASTETAAPAAGAAGDAQQRPRRDEQPDRQARRDRHERQQRSDRQGQRSERKDQGARQGTHGNRAPPRGDRPRRDKGAQVERAEREQYYAKPFGGGGGRNKEPDPNSPFAKLAALKQQLEGKESS
jgi:ATP-dependent RNA helicase SUPV3L1/SUV3